MPFWHIENLDLLFLLAGGWLSQCATAAAAAATTATAPVELLDLYSFRFDFPAALPSKGLLCKTLGKMWNHAWHGH
jgi:hypothetical protein